MMAENSGNDNLDASWSGSYDRSYDRSIEQSVDAHKHGKSYSVSFAVNERSLLLSHQPINGRFGFPEKRENFVNFSIYEKKKNYGKSITESIAYLSRLNKNSFLGFDSTAFAVAREKEVEHSKTLSLADQPSFDRRTLDIVHFFTVLDMITGLTMFPMAYYMALCGWPMVAVCVLTGIVSIYTTILLNRCQYQQSKDGVRKRVYQSFVELGKATIGWHGDKIMQVVVGSNVLVDIYLLIFCARVTVDLFQNTLNIDIRIWLVIWMTVVYPIFLIRRMSIISFMGFIALPFYITAFVISIYELLSELEKFSVSNLNPKLKPIDFFVGYGVMLNSYSYHLAFPILEASMKHPSKCKTLTSAAIIVNIVMKVFYGVLGAGVYGALTQPSILTNFQMSHLVITMNIMIVIRMYSSLPASAFVVFDMMDSAFFPKYPNIGKYKKYLWICLSRFAFGSLLLLIAVMVPKFEMVTSFAGQIRGTLSSVVLPIYFYLKIKKRSLSTFSVVMHWGMIVIACLLAIVGTIYGVIAIVE